MEIGTIGAGDFAQAFAKRALKAGHKVKISNSRGPASLRDIVDQIDVNPVIVSASKVMAADALIVCRS